MSKSISVIGAGSIGVSSALHLQQRGWDVTLIDRNEPARETSYGNAGVINGASMVPLNSPAIHSALASYLRNDKAQLRYNPKHVLKNLPWMLQFLQNSKSRQADKTAAELFSLTSVALDEHKAFMQRAGNSHRLSEKGWLRVYRNEPGFIDDAYEPQQLKRFNIAGQKLNCDELRELEPSLNPIYKSGYLVSGAACINNPGALVQEYAQQFVNDGGRLIKANIESIEHQGTHVICRTNVEPVKSDQVLVAAGPWSNDILNMLSYTSPLGVERGYHIHYQLNAGKTLGRSVYDIHAGFIMSPMEMGLRITSGVDLDHRDAKPNHSQLQQVIPRIEEAIDLGEQTDDPIWQGNRPTFPDSKPVIGKAPNHDNVWVAFGHQHIGLMTGPITGKIIAELISGEQSDFDSTPFNPARYLRSTTRRKPVWESISK